MRSDLRWCSDDFEFIWLGTAIVRGAFINAPDGDIIAWRAVVNVRISASWRVP